MSSKFQRGDTRQQNNGARDAELIDAPEAEHSVIGFAESQARGEVDLQISTAKRFPRSIKQFRERALSYATLDEETAAACFYALPARKNKDGSLGKPIEGPSIRMAEIVAASWGNLRAQAAIVDDDGQFLTVQGRCWDLENNVAISMDVRRRICYADGGRYSADMINTTANAACSIALRNAVFRVVPMAMVKPVYEAARRVAIGDATTLVKKRVDMVGYFAKMGVTAAQLLASVDKASIEDVTVDDLLTLRGFATAIKDGEASVDETFPRVATVKPEAKTASESAAKTKQPKEKEIEAVSEPATIETPVATVTEQSEPKQQEPTTEADPINAASFLHRIENALNKTALNTIWTDAMKALEAKLIDQGECDEIQVLVQEARKRM